MLNALEELARLNADRERETIALRKALRLTIEALTPTTTEAK